MREKSFGLPREHPPCYSSAVANYCFDPNGDRRGSDLQRREAPDARLARNCYFFGSPMLVKLDLRNVAAEGQYEFWQGVTPSAYCVGRVPNGNGLNAVASFWWLDGVMASRFSAGAHQINRDAKVARRSATPFVKVRLYRTGSAQLHDASGVHDLRPGDVHIIDQSRAWAARYERHDQHSIFSPHDLIGYDPSRFPVVLTYGQTTREGRLLHFAIRGFYEALKHGDWDASGIISVVAAVLHGNPGTAKGKSFKAARTKAIRSFASLVDLKADLPAVAIAQQFGVSRATVYRAFREDGGLDRFRMALRLDRTRRILATSEMERGVVARTASEFRFSSSAHFSDAFLQRFGVRPTEAARLPYDGRPSDAASVNDPRDLVATMRHTRELYSRMTG